MGIEGKLVSVVVTKTATGPRIRVTRRGSYGQRVIEDRQINLAGRKERQAAIVALVAPPAVVS